MAVITDPDNLDRDQVIFGSENRLISIYPIGPTQSAEATNGAVTATENTLSSAGASFTGDGVEEDDILTIKNGEAAGHYRITNVAATVLTVSNIDGSTVEWPETESDLTFEVFENGAFASEGFGGDGDTDVGGVTPPSGGDLADGVTLQAVYSFAKLEWRDDQTNVGGDDLIRHEFPFEAITAEQFEIGGGASHDDWNWQSVYTRKKLRTGGWAERDGANVILAEWTGIVTLGFLDPDTNVYYQQTDEVTAPSDFAFLGPVNEAINVFTQSPSFDSRTYLKLFARKKARTYAQSEIADIGVSTIQTIVNRFPLAHALDGAIIVDDANLYGSAPWRQVFQVQAPASDGSKTIGTRTFSSAGSTFESDGVVNGDVLVITSGAETGRYVIESVDSETALTILPDFEFTEWETTEGSLSFRIDSIYRVADKSGGDFAPYTTGAIVETATPGIGTVTDTTAAAFLGAGDGNDAVQAGDLLWITDSTGNDGVYRVLDSSTPNALDPTATVVYVDTRDQPFPAVSESDVEYAVLVRGMYLQFKDEEVQVLDDADLTSVVYTASNATYGGRPTIEIVGDDWDTAVGPGTMIVVSGSEVNSRRYTVHTRETDNIISLVSGNLLINETDNVVNSVIEVREGFRRKIGSATDPDEGFTFAYRWRINGNGASLANVYQFVQYQLRLSTDINFGEEVARGDITDLLMQFATPTGTTLDMFIDNLDLNDINNVTSQDHSGINRNFPFTASGNLVFNVNLRDDANARYWLFFTNDAAGDDAGQNYGTKDAIIVEDADGVEIQGNVNGAGTHTGVPGSVDAAGNVSIPFSYAYDTNDQRGAGSAATTAPVTLVAIGLQTAQFVISAGTITRTTGITISAVAALERNFTGSV